MTDFSSVKGKVAIVTGGGSGIGRAICKSYAANGMKVVVADIVEENGKKTVDAIIADGGDASFFKVDVASEADIKAMVEFTVSTYRHLDGIVNNAGVGGYKALLHEYSGEDYDRVLGINLKGVFNGTKYGIKAILESESHSGFVINVASTASLVVSEGQALYATSKHGVTGITKAAAMDYAKQNITINTICPGLIKTEIMDACTEEMLVSFNASTPCGRMGKPEEIANLALFLASDLARYINGATLVVDAGLSVKKGVSLG